MLLRTLRIELTSSFHQKLNRIKGEEQHQSEKEGYTSIISILRFTKKLNADFLHVCVCLVNISATSVHVCVWRGVGWGGVHSLLNCLEIQLRNPICGIFVHRLNLCKSLTTAKLLKPQYCYCFQLGNIYLHFYQRKLGRCRLDIKYIAISIPLLIFLNTSKIIKQNYIFF